MDNLIDTAALRALAEAATADEDADNERLSTMLYLASEHRAISALCKEVERLRESVDLYAHLHHEARAALRSVADRMDEHAYSEIDAHLSDGPSDEDGREYRSRLMAAEAEVEMLGGLNDDLERQIYAEVIHAELGPDGSCVVCTHMEVEDILSDLERAEARAEAAEAEVERLRELVERFANQRQTRYDAITTAAELDALPGETVLLDKNRLPVWRGFFGWMTANGSKDVEPDLVIRDGAPLTVVYRPDRDDLR